MPDRKALRPGDKVRLLRVRDSALRTRDWELHRGVEEPGWTADTIERILRHDPAVVIDRIDEYGQPWFNYDLPGEDGRIEQHTLAITDRESWEMA